MPAITTAPSTTVSTAARTAPRPNTPRRARTPEAMACGVDLSEPHRQDATGHEVVEHDECRRVHPAHGLHHEHCHCRQQYEHKQRADGTAYSEGTRLCGRNVATGNGRRAHVALADLHAHKEQDERQHERDMWDMGEGEIHGRRNLASAPSHKLRGSSRLRPIVMRRPRQSQYARYWG